MSSLVPFSTAFRAPNDDEKPDILRALNEKRFSITEEPGGFVICNEDWFIRNFDRNFGNKSTINEGVASLRGFGPVLVTRTGTDSLTIEMPSGAKSSIGIIDAKNLTATTKQFVPETFKRIADKPQLTALIARYNEAHPQMRQGTLSFDYTDMLYHPVTIGKFVLFDGEPAYHYAASHFLMGDGAKLHRIMVNHAAPFIASGLILPKEEDIAKHITAFENIIRSQINV